MPACISIFTITEKMGIITDGLKIYAARGKWLPEQPRSGASVRQDAHFLCGFESLKKRHGMSGITKMVKYRKRRRGK